MTVYYVWHSDIEDDRYVRGIFASRELAEQAITLDETGNGYRRKHAEWCCAVVEEELATELPRVEYGPDRRDMVDPSGGALVPNSFFEEWLRMAAQH